MRPAASQTRAVPWRRHRVSGVRLRRSRAHDLDRPGWTDGCQYEFEAILQGAEQVVHSGQRRERGRAGGQRLGGGRGQGAGGVELKLAGQGRRGERRLGAAEGGVDAVLVPGADPQDGGEGVREDPRGAVVGDAADLGGQGEAGGVEGPVKSSRPTPSPPPPSRAVATV
ncbi:hypothetical protein [Dactylosporangium sp. NPDC000521]|uniref:hypothetical protein n=1 Tax=Dactylosporangium sp. NPDC000521 TaxID=3363975 RepID=UPI00369C6DF9